MAGAGFAEVETLGAINDFLREAIRFYPNLKPEFVRTVLIASGEFILPELGHKLGAYPQRKLAARGVEIITHAKVTAIREAFVELSDGQKIRATTLVWAAGNAPNPLIDALPIPKSAGQIQVNEYSEFKDFRSRITAICSPAIGFSSAAVSLSRPSEHERRRSPGPARR